MNDSELLLAIQELLSGQEWNVNTVAEIALLLGENGYQIDDIDY